MNVRDRYPTTRARSISPSSSRRSLEVHRTLAKLKKAKEEGPSPTSVTTQSFDFSDAPFDCSVSAKKRASSVGNLQKMNSTRLQSLRTSNLLPPGPSLKKNHPGIRTFSEIPPRSPRPTKAMKAHLKPTAGSPGDSSVSKKASSYRQQRMKLARQKKWKDEGVDTAVQSRITHQGDNVSIRDTIRGKDKFYNGLDGVELSLSSHLEKGEFARSFTSGGQEQIAERGEYPIQAARVDSKLHHHAECNDTDDVSRGSNINDEYDDAMTIDTVSSLNTMHTEASGWSTPGLRSPVSSPKKFKSRKVNRIAKPVEKDNIEDELHPPMYVQSRVRKLKNGPTKEDQESHLGAIAPVTDAETNVKMTDVTSSMNSSHHSCTLIEGLDAVSNKKSHDEDDDDNDIPAITSNSSKCDGVSPTSHLLVENATQCDERSVVSLRKKRLQKMRIARNKTKTETSTVPAPSTLKDKESAETKSESQETNTKISKEIKDVVIIKKPPAPPKRMKKSMNSTKSSPFDEDKFTGKEKRQGDDHNDDAIDFDLHKLGDQRKGEDDNSIVTSKTVQTMTTLKTCFTISSATKMDMERMIKRKQNRVKWIHHVLTCTHPYPESVDDESYVPCPEVNHCHALGVLVRHVQTCTHSDLMNGSICEVPSCAAYKKVWNHYRRCVLRTFTKSNRKKCRICADIFNVGPTSEDCSDF